MLIYRQKKYTNNNVTCSFSDKNPTVQIKNTLSQNTQFNDTTNGHTIVILKLRQVKITEMIVNVTH